MQFKEKLKPLDDLFGKFFVFSPILSALLVALGVSYIAVFIPLVTFLAWTIYIYYYRARYLFQDSKELALLERVRGFAYFFGLVTTFISSGLLYSFRELTNQIVIGAIMLIILFILDWFVPKFFFSPQTLFFRKDQRTKLGKMVFKVNSAAIYFSSIVSTLNIAFTTYITTEISIIGSVLFFAVMLGAISPFAFLTYYEEKRSRKLSFDLAISLKQSKWVKKYESKSK